MAEPVALPVQLRAHRLAHAALRLAGWRVRFNGLPAKQGVIIVYPHTSNWDFIVGIVAKWAVGIRVTFWGKDSLFEVPLFGRWLRWLRWLGGVAVDRASPTGIVGQMVSEIAAARAQGRFLWLALSPEGTRGYREVWRSGFYHLALQAQVPVGLASLDYARREVALEHFVMLTGDVKADLAEVQSRLPTPVGKRPALAAPIRFEK